MVKLATNIHIPVREHITIFRPITSKTFPIGNILIDFTFNMRYYYRTVTMGTAYALDVTNPTVTFSCHPCEGRDPVFSDASGFLRLRRTGMTGVTSSAYAGNGDNMNYTPKQIGDLAREARRSMGVTQKDIALTSGTGLRFIIDMEKGKSTCQLGKVLTVLQTLGIQVKLTHGKEE